MNTLRLLATRNPMLVAPLGAAAVLAYDNKSKSSNCDVASAKVKIVELMEKSAEKNGDGSSIGPTLVRLAWHASGTYSKKDKSGGSDGGKMKYDPEASWGANAGLADARAAMEAIAAECGLTRADAYTLCGAVAIEEMGGPHIPWKEGRSDEPDGKTSPPDGRLPDADKGSFKGTIQHLRDIFYRMGFNDRDIVALSGAHALGRCHENASGYWGPWTYAETTFSNEYYRLLLEGAWTLKTTHKGKPWTGPEQFETPDGALMMLPSDMALTWDKSFRAIVEEYAKDEEKFFKDFAAAFSKLLELGCTFPNAPKKGLLGKLGLA